MWWFYWTKHTIEFSSNTPIQHLNYSYKKSHRWTVILFIIITAFPRQLNQLYQRFACHANPISVIHTTKFLSQTPSHHQKMTKNSFKQETKTLYNWKPVKPLLTRRNTEENSSFFPPRRGDSYNYTDPQTPMQPEKGWSRTQIRAFRFILTWTVEQNP